MMEKPSGTRKENKKNKLNQNISVGRRVMNAIRKLQGNKGISLPDLKKFLRDRKNMDVGMHDAEIKLSLKNAIDRGMLVRESGNYKVREAKRRRSRSKGRKSRRRKSSGRKRSGSRRRKGSSKRRSGKRRSRRRKKATQEEM